MRPFLSQDKLVIGDCIVNNLVIIALLINVLIVSISIDNQFVQKFPVGFSTQEVRTISNGSCLCGATSFQIIEHDLQFSGSVQVFVTRRFDLEFEVRNEGTGEVLPNGINDVLVLEASCEALRLVQSRADSTDPNFPEKITNKYGNTHYGLGPEASNPLECYSKHVGTNLTAVKQPSDFHAQLKVYDPVSGSAYLIYNVAFMYGYASVTIMPLDPTVTGTSLINAFKQGADAKSLFTFATGEDPLKHTLHSSTCHCGVPRTALAVANEVGATAGFITIIAASFFGILSIVILVRQSRERRRRAVENNNELSHVKVTE